MIKFTETKNKQAKVVLEAVKMLLDQLNPDKYDFEVLQRDFDNGREQGYVIELTAVNNKWLLHEGLHVAFAEYHNSDSIVVYTDKDSYYPETIKESFWNSSKTFTYGSILEAAEYIVEIIKNRVNELQEV